MRALTVLPAAALLAACAVTSEVVEVESGAYLVSARAAVVSEGMAIAKNGAYEEARNFCAAQNARMYLVEPRAKGVSPDPAGAAVNASVAAVGVDTLPATRAELRFRCEK